MSPTPLSSSGSSISEPGQVSTARISVETSSRVEPSSQVYQEEDAGNLLGHAERVVRLPPNYKEAWNDNNQIITEVTQFNPSISVQLAVALHVFAPLLVSSRSVACFMPFDRIASAMHGPVTISKNRIMVIRSASVDPAFVLAFIMSRVTHTRGLTQ